jgi:hypothetical protein
MSGAHDRHSCQICGRRVRRWVVFVPPRVGHVVYFCADCTLSLMSWDKRDLVPGSGDRKNGGLHVE